MKIALLNAHNTLNYGSMMMLENVITHLRPLLADARFVVLSDRVGKTLNRVRSATGCEEIEVRPRFAALLSAQVAPRFLRSFVDRVLLRYFSLFRAVKDCDAQLILGGDDLSEYYGKLRIVDVFLRLATAKMVGQRVFLLGQTVGPFTRWRRPMARWVFDWMDAVYHRGPESLRYAREVLGCKGEQALAADLAFLPLAREEDREIISRLGLRDGRYLVLVPSGLRTAYYGRDQAAYVGGLVQIASHLLRLGENSDLVLVLLPHVVSDRRLVRALKERLQSPRVVAVLETLLPFEARAILGGSLMNVSQRMHGAISSLEQGVPVVALAYSVKYADVLGAQLGLSELVVEADRSGFAATATAACGRIDQVWGALGDWRARIREAAGRARSDAARQIEELAQRLSHEVGPLAAKAEKQWSSRDWSN